MKRNKTSAIKKKIVISIISAIAIICLVFLFAFLKIALKVPYAEHRYKKSGSEEDLVNLCIALMDYPCYGKAVTYFPKAIYLDNVIELIEKGEYAQKNKDIYKFSEKTYGRMIIHYLFSCIYENEYEQFQDDFPVLYEKFIQISGTDSYWLGYAGFNSISAKGYARIIQSLKEACPEYPEISAENSDNILLYVRNLNLQSLTYFYMGDKENHDKVNQIWENIVADLYETVKRQKNEEQ